MTDPRLTQLADNLVNYSCRVQPGERVLIEMFDCEDILAEELIKAVYRAGGVPFVDVIRTKVQREWLIGLSKEQVELQTKWDLARMEDMDAYIAFRGSENSMENSDVPTEQMHYYQSIYSHQVHSELRVKNTKWVVLRYPNPSMAQLSGKSTRSFEDFYFNVCNLDYSKMNEAMKPLVALMERTDKVRITAKDTDITFSIKGQKAVPCAGHCNIPDGEVYTSPIRDSINGRITYNTPSIYQGFKFENVSLLFKDGKIIEATANDNERINHIFDTDDGARYVGEFALGVNPYIMDPMCDILFDEKISGSIHFTPGSAYDDADNGNRSAIHWDLVLIQREEWGGGDIWFDDVLIRHNGRFMIPELECLNPENLI
ncbi:MAG: aminopeptidase [Christensenellaceae bacterium]|nr:aminopeptidase [Christensenellaceae bacterium]